jgi:hypothetical protein
MQFEKFMGPLILTIGLFTGVAALAQQEPPPFQGGADAQAPDEAQQGGITDANTNDPAAVAESTDYFQKQLAPYGEWVNHDGTGEVWVPKVEPGWRPYTSGHWDYTDQGWGWVADEPWGWAPFHYGRWDYDQQLGWAWTPGNVWAPAWVAWRSGGGYLGWAPLSSAVGFSAEEGLGAAAAAITAGYFTFVAEQNILHPHVAEVILPSTRNTIIVNNTSNITRYAVSNHRIINSGIDVHRIEKVTGRPVQVVRVAALAQAGAHGRGAFYQPEVAVRAAASTRAEFGPALKAQRAAQSPNRRGTNPSSPRNSRPLTDRSSSPTSGTNPSSTTRSGYPYRPSHPTSPETQNQHYVPGQPRTPPQHSTSPQPPAPRQPTVAPPAKSEEKPQPKKSEDKSKHKPPV